MTAYFTRTRLDFDNECSVPNVLLRSDGANGTNAHIWSPSVSAWLPDPHLLDDLHTGADDVEQLTVDQARQHFPAAFE